MTPVLLLDWSGVPIDRHPAVTISIPRRDREPHGVKTAVVARFDLMAHPCAATMPGHRADHVRTRKIFAADDRPGSSAMPKFSTDTFFVHVHAQREDLTSGKNSRLKAAGFAIVTACLSKAGAAASGKDSKDAYDLKSDFKTASSGGASSAAAASSGGGDAKSGAKAVLTTIDTKCTTHEAPVRIQQYVGVASQEAGSIYIGMLGEDHDDRTDRIRGGNVAAAIDTLNPTLVFYERELKRRHGVGLVPGDKQATEEEIIVGGMPLSPPARSFLWAAYLAVCLMMASEGEVIIVFAGERHKDMFQYLELIIAQCDAAKPLQARRRYYQLIRSYTTQRDAGSIVKNPFAAGAVTAEL